MSPVTNTHSAWLVRRVCGQHVEETPLTESPAQEVGRAIRSCATLTASIGARVNPIYMNEVIRLFEELHDVHTGEHRDIRTNAALTVNNVPALTDYIQGLINQAITGQFAGRNRDELSAHELVLVTL